MNNKPKVKGLIERKLEDPEYKKRHDERYAAFKLEAQILYALEEKGMTYSQLAEATGTSKSNVSRDLKAGGILKASFSRISKIAGALGMQLVAILIPQEKAEAFISKVEEWYRTTTNAKPADVKFLQTTDVPLSIQPTYSVLSCDENQITNFKPAGLEIISLSTAA